MDNVISVNNLVKNFDYYVKEDGVKGSIKNLFYRKKLVKKSVKSISFDVKEGEFVGFLGPNGAGKTTTLKMLSGILFPTEGKAKVLGYVPWERKNEFKKQFSIIMGQKNQLWWDLPAKESLYLNKRIYEIDDKEYKDTVETLSELLDVKHVMDIQVRRLSLGERMKLEIIASLIHKPKVIFLDEPTIGLDLVSQRNIRNFLSLYNKEYNTTILLTSHYMKDIEDLCTRTIVINEGSIVYDGEKEGLNSLNNDKKIIKIQLSKNVDKSELDNISKIRNMDKMSVEFEINKKELTQKLQEIVDVLPINDFSIADIPLEEGLEKLYEKRRD